ncbi:MAG: hypothetical protein KC910_28745 [Candidatus Eremiobacteraeota bacterium]|nr:hypothetical protein [Candidatus Eremiobacteraeota bacterium]
MKKQLVSLVTLAVLAFAPAWAEPQQEPPQQPPQQTVEVVQAEAPQEELQRPAQQEPLEVDQNQKSRDFLIPDFDLDSGF